MLRPVHLKICNDSKKVALRVYSVLADFVKSSFRSRMNQLDFFFLILRKARRVHIACVSLTLYIGMSYVEVLTKKRHVKLMGFLVSLSLSEPTGFVVVSQCIVRHGPH